MNCRAVNTILTSNTCYDYMDADDEDEESDAIDAMNAAAERERVAVLKERIATSKESMHVCEKKRKREGKKRKKGKGEEGNEDGRSEESGGGEDESERDGDGDGAGAGGSDISGYVVDVIFQRDLQKAGEDLHDAVFKAKVDYVMRRSTAAKATEEVAEKNLQRATAALKKLSKEIKKLCERQVLEAKVRAAAKKKAEDAARAIDKK